MNRIFIYYIFFSVIFLSNQNIKCMESESKGVKSENVKIILAEANSIEGSLEDLILENFDIKSKVKRLKVPKSLSTILDIVALLGTIATIIEFAKNGKVDSICPYVGVFGYVLSRCICFLDKLEEINFENNVKKYRSNLKSSLDGLSQKLVKLNGKEDKNIFDQEDSKKFLCLSRKFKFLNGKYQMPEEIKSANENVGQELEKLCSGLEPHIQ